MFGTPEEVVKTTDIFDKSREADHARKISCSLLIDFIIEGEWSLELGTVFCFKNQLMRYPRVKSNEDRAHHRSQD